MSGFLLDPFVSFPSGGGPFVDPTSYSGLIAWIDPTDGATVTLDGSSKISAISDKSGHGNNAGRTDAATRPGYAGNAPNAANVATFTGSQRLDWLHNVNQPCTIICAHKNSVAGAFLYDGYSGRLALAHITANAASNSNKLTAYAGTGLGNDAASDSINLNIVSTVIFNGASSLLRRNGVDLATGNLGAQNDTGGLAFGLSVNGYVGQIIIYNRVLTLAQYTDNENFAATKLGITF